jgi:hypothetical protein
MGGGTWDSVTYKSTSTARVAAKVDDFAYSASASSIHDNLDPRRINTKPFGKLESRDSAEHPESNAIAVSFDVTGSNISRAREAQKVLDKLMGLLTKYIKDPQVSFAANDDYKVEGRKSVQMSDFESDIRIDEHLRNIWLVGDGGGNDGESYDLIMYAYAYKTVLDCFEKRGKKGYLFMYCDEPIFDFVDKHEVKDIFGDTIQKNIPIAEVIEDLRKLYTVYIIWPRQGYDHALKQYKQLFGDEFVLELQHPNMICELIGTTVGLNEQNLDEDTAIHDLVASGTSKKDAKELVTAALAKIPKSAKATGELVKSGAGSAALL